MKYGDIARKYSNFYAPTFQVKVDGEEIQRDSLVQVTRVTFDDTLEGADRFSIAINDPGAKWIDDGLFDPGKEVEIKMGYVDQTPTMIVGEIISLRPSFPADGSPRLEISGYDLSHQFTRVRKQRSFQNMKDSDVVSAIAGEAKHKLSTQIDATDVVHPHIVQESQTDYDLMTRLAERNFFKFLVRERSLYFQKARTGTQPVLTLEYGASLQSFEPELNTAGQVSEVTVRGWNPSTKQEIVGRARRGSEEARQGGRRSGGDIVEGIYGSVEERVLDRPVFTQQEADNMARSVLNRVSEGLVTGRGVCIGIPDLRAGENIEIEGLGQKFSKRYHIQRTTHTISASGYITSFEVKENTI